MINKQKIFIFFLGLVILVAFVLVIYFNYLKPKDEDTFIVDRQPVPNLAINPPKESEVLREVDSNNLAKLIGKTASEVTEHVGPPTGETNDRQFSYLEFANSTIFPDIATIQEDGAVVLFKERILSTDSRFNLKTVDSGLANSASFEKYTQNDGPAYKLTIYQTEGLAFLRHQQERNLIQIWYFSPTTRRIIEATWGKDLINPEDFQYHQN